ncbi:hypothetical protein V5O48_004639 [Marasmius crinis-equi]|uniref:Aldehyde dehydrogenase domain-containing protein n=2 Tax=Marasmius crinis-equi TaxID=585013 RepID=A0ABR3FPH0_9AGAR
MSSSLPFTPVYINGQSITTKSQFAVINPLTSEPVGQSASASLQDCQNAISSAHSAFQSWSSTSITYRRDIFLRAADIVHKYKDRIIQAVMQETGASLEMGMFNYATSAGFLKASAALVANELRGQRFPSERNPEAVVWTEKRPFGVIFTQSPWNAPIALTLRAVVIPILCGNTVVFRPSELSPHSCSIVYELFQEAGLPDGVFNFLPISREDTPEMTREIIADIRVRKVTFTGSDRVGRIIALESAKHLKPCILELGGKAPAIVLNDADVALAAQSIVTGAMLHSGQICMSTERVIVQSGVGEEFTEELLKWAGKLGTVTKEGGDGGKKGVLGPLFSTPHAENVLGMIKEAQMKGAQVLVGDVKREGAVVKPHVLALEKDNIVASGSGKIPNIWERESFGPVLLLTIVDTLDEAIDLANQSDYSLTSSLWTKDVNHAQSVAGRIRAGYTNINGSTIHSEPTVGLVGLGGSSGYGRFSVDDFTYSKVVVVHPPGGTSVLFD